MSRLYNYSDQFIVRLSGRESIIISYRLPVSVSRLSNYSDRFIVRPSGRENIIISYRLPESVSRLSDYSVGLSSDYRVGKVIYLWTSGVGVPSV